jgi:hypothetical protein
MKILSALIVGGALTLGMAMAQDAPKPANPAAPATQTKAKKHRRHHKKGAADKAGQTAAPATVAPANVAPKK